MAKVSREFGFDVENINVFRDFVQGLYGNRVPLNDPDVLEYFSLWNELVEYDIAEEIAKTSPEAYYAKAYPNDLSSFLPHAIIAPPESITRFTGSEVGGAQPQVDAVFRNADPSEAWRALREVAPKSVIRPLERATNVFMLEPRPVDEIEQVLRQVAEDTAGKHLWGTSNELLRVKIFDSQAVFEEIEPVVEIIKKLRGEGYPIGVEIAIPYSKGEGCDPNDLDYNPYPDEFYIKKALEAAKLAETYGIPQELFRVSLKDMVGELDAATAERLTGKLIEAFKAEDLEFTFGLHLHDTGLAADAYAAAIRVCKEKNWPIAIDTVEGLDTGFASTLEVDERLKDLGVDQGLALDPKQRDLTAQMREKARYIAEKYDVRRVEPGLSGEELRKYKIPGGGSASTITRIKDSKLAERLGISDQEAVRTIGEALIAVDRLMGHPFAVTPGYQNKLMAAQNLVDNMIAEGLIKKGMSADEVKEVVLAPLEDQQVQDLFLKGLNDKVKEFLKGKMPANERVHPIIRMDLPQRDGILIDGLVSRLTAIEAVAKHLLKDGYIKPSATQIRAAEALFRAEIKEQLQEKKPLGAIDEEVIPVTKAEIDDAIALLDSGEKEAKIAAIAEMKAYNSAVTRGVILGGGEKLHQALTKPWLKEPDPSEYQGRAEAYKRANDRFKKGLNPDPDEVEKIRDMVLARKLDPVTAKKHVETLLQAERLDIRASVLGAIEKTHGETIIAAAMEAIEATGSSEASIESMQQITNAIYAQQKKIVSEAASQEGKLFLYPEDIRVNIALEALAEEIEAVTQKLPASSDTATKLPALIDKIITQERRDIESAAITAPMPGVVVKRLVNPKIGKPVEVKKGDVLFVMEAMKMEHTVRATKDGLVFEMLFEEGSAVNTGDVVVKYQPEIAVDSDVKVAESKVFAKKSELIEGLELAIAEKLEASKHQSEILAAQAVEELVARKVAAVAESQISAPTSAEAKGFNSSKPLTPREHMGLSEDKTIHVVGNRAGCAAKIVGDLEQRDCDVRVLYKEGDKTTPVIKNSDPEKTILIKDYMDQDEMIVVLKKLAQENYGKKIAFHPGWGFLSEKDDFVKRIEEECGDNIIFVGPPSESMRLAGGKKTFRDIVQEAAPEFNPGYFGCEGSDLEDLDSYVKAGFPRGTPMDIIQRANFEKVCNMGGDVMIKAVAGGGGRGIINYKYDEDLSKEVNFKEYEAAVLKTRQDAKELFHNDEVLVEQCIRGNTRHFEVQIAATNGSAVILGSRDCTTQNGNQKVLETNVIKGDYPPEVIEQINIAAQNIADELAKMGYRGLGTLEMLVSEKNGKIFLEVNTRTQVEHPVTEEDIYLKTGKRISLPYVNYCMAVNDGIQTPQQILDDEFGLTADDIEAANRPGTERVVHVRVNSKYIDLVNGKAIPSWFSDTMWPEGISAYIAKKTGASIDQGGLGDGKSDSQVGAIWGAKQETVAAAAMLLDFSRLSQVFERAYGGYKNHNNLEAVRDIFPLLFVEKGTVSQEFSTQTFDELLACVATGEVTLTKKDGLWPGQRVYAEGSLKSALQHVYDKHSIVAEEQMDERNSHGSVVLSFAEKVNGSANSHTQRAQHRRSDLQESGVHY